MTGALRERNVITLDHARLAANLHQVSARIDAACARVGRETDDVELVAVTKYVEADVVAALARAGVECVGESRPQVLWQKPAAVRGLDAPALRWDLIGHLQRNKVRRTLPHVDRFHALDSLRLAETLDGELGRAGRESLAVFVQVNVSGEETKSGFSPDELETALARARELPRLDVVGLMTMAPASESPEHTRAVFRSLRKLRDEMHDRGYLDGLGLSMGMSSDFEVAIEEGATAIRVGSALYAGIRD